MSATQRVHYFTVQECKRVFMSPDYGIVRFGDMIANAHEYGLSKVYVAGISVEHLPLYYRQFFFTETYFSAGEFLCDFWSQHYSNEYAGGISGKPNVLVIDRRLEECLDTVFIEWLDKEGIMYRYSASGDKKFSSTVRYHQRYPHIFTYRDATPAPVPNSREPWPLQLNVLNAKEASHTSLRGHLSPAVRKVIAELYPNDFRPELPTMPPVNDDFLVKENLLRVASSNDVELNSVVWYPARAEPFSYGFAVNNSEILQEEEAASAIWQKEMLIALQCLELQFDGVARELTGRFGNNNYPDILNKIKKNNYRTLLSLSGVEQDVLFGFLGLNTKKLAGNTLYNISKIGVADMVILWDHITDGGDQRQSFEIRPRKGIDDPAYRLFAVIGYHSCYFLFSHRTSRSCNALDSGRCINYESAQPFLVRHLDYRKMLNCAIKGKIETFASVLKTYLDIYPEY
ncbi:hypothetical protein V1951_22105 [Yersinia sp. 2544 StPb PI]|uniref:hypothetical protein n=1 Tax=Yersinia sp. 2544 StPb PI TaxID=3117409 RepID=UPI003B27CA5B